MRKSLMEQYPLLISFIILIFAGIFIVIPEFAEISPSFLPGFVATGLGVLQGASLSLYLMDGRNKRAHNKFLHDIYIELNKNSNHLDSHGNILNTDIWDSGISSGSILVIDSKELDELSEVYHQIETNI